MTISNSIALIILFLFRLLSLPRMARSIEQALIHLSFEEVAAKAGRKVLIVFDDNILLIVGDPQGILD